MKKSILYLLAALLIGGLVGCNAANEIAQNPNGDTNNQFYENVNERNRPLGEKVNYNNGGASTEPDAKRELTTLENRFKRDDFNYHGQMNKPYYNQNRTYTNMRDKRIAQRISNRLMDMNGINNARTIVQEDTIYVAIDPKNNSVSTDEIREIVKDMAVGRNVKVVIDTTKFNR